MGRYAIIEGGTVVNVVEATPEVAAENGWYIASGRVERGWTFDGAFIEPVIDPAVVRAAIAPITRRQARLALLGAGLLANVDAVLAALPSPQKDAAQIEWQDALVFERGHPLIATMGAALGLTDVQIDTLFRTAATL